MFIKILFSVLSLVFLSSCTNSASQGSIEKKPFGKTRDGQPVEIYTLVNKNGLSAEISNYGGIVRTLSVPDKSGQFLDIVAGYNTLEEYLNWSPHYGCIVGRFSNRIAGGKFSIDGKEYVLAQNNSGNNLHGGPKGFDKVVWKARDYISDSGPALELTYLSPDGDQGFPGNLSVKTVYTLTNDNELKVEYTATTDKKTVVNLTHHSYFNLSGPSNGDILDHIVTLNADKFTPVDKTGIPTGEFRSVSGTPFDFRKPHSLGKRINVNNDQLKKGAGYDHNWIVNGKKGELTLGATVYDPKSGRVMEVYSDKPGMQLYTGNFLEKDIGKDGKPYKRRYALCLEPQDFPDAPNKKNFPSTLLSPGETYSHTLIYKFSVR